MKTKRRIIISIVGGLMIGVALAIISFCTYENHVFTDVEQQEMKEIAVQTQKMYDEYGTKKADFQNYSSEVIGENRINVYSNNGRIEFDLEKETENNVPLNWKFGRAVIVFAWGCFVGIIVFNELLKYKYQKNNKNKAI